ncbi:MAG: N-acetylglucosamine-6-phosphate deacetylase [Lachnospiraceae bacterium]|nr:N-acetylglucosamine-6-phosphate deacetylase [Lachnospiraceae bacterium]
MTEIRNVKIFTEQHTFREGSIAIKDGLFAEPAENPGKIIDGQGCYAIPGLIDIHFHGCMGYDFCDGTQEALREIARYEASVGVTGMAPATMTLPAEQLEEILSNAAAFSADSGKNPGEAELLGVNMEGPFISKHKKGAQDDTYIIPSDVELFHRFQRAAEGLVKFIAVAPEVEGALAFVDRVKDEAVVSLAHTNADYDEALAAFQRGASHAVHLFNAMPPFGHREPGVVGAVADSHHVTAELICDGIHIHPSVVRAAFKILGENRIILISDSMRAAGMPDGTYTLGGQAVQVTRGRAVLVSSGALAGSASNLMECMKTSVKEMGIPLETAVACASENPAKRLGEYGRRGSITFGKKADLVLLDRDLNVKCVMKDGKRVG